VGDGASAAADSRTSDVLTSTAADATATGSSTAADTEAEEGEGMDPEEQAQYAAAAAVDYEYSGEGPVPPELYFRQQVTNGSGQLNMLTCRVCVINTPLFQQALLGSNCCWVCVHGC
jgi:hypothetical protein